MKNNTDKSSNRLLNIISLLLCILLWSAGLAENAILSVPTAKTPPTIDGEMDAIWYSVPSIPVAKTNTEGVPAPDNWLDCFAYFRIMADNENVYFYFQVYDDQINTSNETAWRNDGIELFFDGDNSKNDASIGYDNNDIHYRFSYGTPTEDTGNLLNSEFVFKNTDNGYNFEIRIPVSEMPFTLNPEQPFGLEIQINDNDTGDRNHLLKWWSGSNDARTNPSLFGTAQLKQYAASDPMLVYGAIESPVIDGLNDETLWDNLPWFSSNFFVDRFNGEPLIPPFDINNVSHHNDCRFDMKMTWFGNILYFYANVFDDIIDVSSPDSWANDGISLQIDGRNEKTAWLDNNDFPVDAVYTTRATEDLAFTETDEGWSVEGRVDFSDHSIDLSVGHQMGFDVQLNDNDGAGREIWSKWWTHDEAGWSNPGLRGTVELANALDGGSASGTFSLTGPTGGDVWEVGTEQEIAWSVQGDVDQVGILLSRDGGGSWEYISEGTDNDGSYTWTVTIPTSGNCLIQVYDVNDEYTYGESLSTFSIRPQSIQSLSSPATQPAGSAQSAYRLVSVPLDLDDASVSGTFLDDLGSVDDTKWRLYNFQGGTWTGYTSSMQIDPGKSYFLIVNNSGIRLDAGAGYLIGDESFDIDVDPGWNSIANPYNFDLTDMEVTDDYGDQITLWSYDGYWDIAYDFLPWAGYAVYSEEGGTLTVTPDWYGPAKMSRTDFRDSAEWYIQIEAACENARDPVNYCGLVPEKSRDFCRKEPPPVGEYIRFYFQNIDPEQPSGAYSTAFNNEDAELHSWEVAVETNIQNQAVSLRIPQLKNVPDGYTVFLKDCPAGRTEILSSGWTPCFVSGAGTTKKVFELIIGDPNELTDQATAPAQFRLGQNYPNPFNNASVIPFSLAEDSDVTLVIYSLEGKEICRPVRTESYPAGSHKIIWSGQDTFQQPVSSGVYFYHLNTSTGSSAVQRMLLLK